ncbi:MULTISPECIES: ProQ/FINO family protein [Bradyrhizobium]|uniref:ProQ/FINO family protein n=1 Tax=Bradyrhizobium elkanii TaxID=29448 RepID=UPI00041EEFA0|nr:ProQ/FinO family protein [Bradyrhizobium elkanii]
MTIAKEDLQAALAYLAERFPQTFVLERHQPHRPLKVGIADDLVARCPELDRSKLGIVLGTYARRVMYRKGMVAGAARIDLDGNACGEASGGAGASGRNASSRKDAEGQARAAPASVPLKVRMNFPVADVLVY